MVPFSPLQIIALSHHEFDDATILYELGAHLFQLAFALDVIVVECRRVICPAYSLQ